MSKARSLKVANGGAPITRTAPDLTERQEKFLVAPEKNKFDMRTHIRDPKTGALIRHQPYSFVKNAEGQEFYLRDGKRFNRNGTLLGSDVKAK